MLAPSDSAFDIDAFAEAVEAQRRAYVRCCPTADRAETLVEAALSLLFPQFAAGRDARAEAERFRALVRDLLAPLVHERAGPLAQATLAALPGLRDALLEDAEATEAGDPAAESVEEVILAYPGWYATAVHRLAHTLYRARVPLVPRMLAEAAHRRTGVDIHPGARIGRRFSIDHGTGVVIGETAVVGDRVRVFQGVTLGALFVAKGLATTKRHPTIEDDVVLYANATVLGGDTVIGTGSTIGGNVWLTRSVPPGSVVTHVAQLRTQDGRTQPLPEYVI
jgi:serine O-acetyltransferase